MTRPIDTNTGTLFSDIALLRKQQSQQVPRYGWSTEPHMDVITRQAALLARCREALERIRRTGFVSVKDESPHRIAADMLAALDKAGVEP